MHLAPREDEAFRSSDLCRPLLEFTAHPSGRSENGKGAR
jgi:hypothetical protein